MPIKVDRFLGMVPLLDPARLPDGASQILHNFVATSGTLAPINAQGPFVSSHDEGGLLRPGISADEVVSIPKPAAPSVASRSWIAKIDQWMSVTLLRFLEWMDPVTGNREVAWNSIPLLYTWDYNETGIDLYCHSASALPSVTIYNGVVTYLRGPRFMFEFNPDPGGLNGGPATGLDLPTVVFGQSPVFSTNRIPLYDSRGNCYAEFQVLDYSGPLYDEKFLVQDPYEFYVYTYSAFVGSFRIALHYTLNKRRHYFYVTSNVDALEREGPPSEISAEVIVAPGEIVTINTPHMGGGKVRLYRSDTGHDDFLLLDEGSFNTYEDPPNPVQANEEIPPFGNWDDSGAPDVATFLIGSVLHPSQFGVAYYGKKVYCSDRERLHAWPKENTYTFVEDIQAIALTGDTVLVFTETGVYGVSGTDPARMATFLISNSHPLLNAAGLCQIGGRVYWPTYDGLAVSTGSTVEIVTAQHFTRNDWLDMVPSDMWAKTADGCVYLETNAAPSAPPSDKWLRLTMLNVASVVGAAKLNVRVDLDAGETAISTYDSETSPGQCRWRSKLFVFDNDTAIDLIRVCASGTCTCTAIIDGDAQSAVTVSNDTPKPVDWPHGRLIQFELASSGPIYCFEAFERVVAPGQDLIEFTPANTPSFRNLRIGYAEPQQLAAAAVAFQTTASEPGVAVKFYRGHESAAFYSKTITDGGVIHIPYASRVTDTEFRVVVETDRVVERAVIAREVPTPAGEAIEEARTGQIAPWLLKHYTFEQPVHLRSVRVSASAAVTMLVYVDGATTPAKSVSIANAWEYRVATTSSFTRLRFRFVDGGGNAADHLVNTVIVATSRPQDAPADGVHLQGAPAYRRQIYRFAEHAVFSAVSVTADAYPLYLDIYRFGQASPDFTITLTGSGTVGLPWELSRTSDLWEFDLRRTATDLTARVHAMHLYVKRGVPVEGPHVRVMNTGGAAPWLWARYEYAKAVWWPSYRVETADGEDVFMALYVDGELVSTFECVSGQEAYLNTFLSPRHGHTLEFRFFEESGRTNPADSRVKVACVYGGAPVQVSGPVVLADFPWLWRQFNFPHAGRFTAAQLVMRDTYPATDVRLRLYNQSSNVTVIPPGNKAFALPSNLANAGEWYTSIENASEVVSMTLYPETTLPARGAIEAHAQPGCPDWLRSRYEWAEATVMAAVRVESESYPVTLRAETDNGTFAVEVESDAWTATGWSTEANTVIFRFFDGGTPCDERVRCLRVLSQQDMVVGNDGVVSLDGLPCYTGIRLRFLETGAWAGVSVDADAAATVTLERISPASPIYNATASIGANDPALHRVLGAGETVEEALSAPTYGTIWRLSVVSTGTVRSVTLFAWRPEPVSDLIRVVQEPLPVWYMTRYQLAETRAPRSVIVQGQTDMDLYAITNAGYNQVILDADDLAEGEQRIDGRYPCREIVLDFTAPTGLKTALVGFEEHVPVGPTGLILRQAGGSPFWRNKVLRFSEPGSFGAVRARCAATIRLKPYGAATWAVTESLGDGEGYTAVCDVENGDTEWELDVQHGEPLDELVLFSRCFHSVEGGVVVIRREGEPFTWLDKRILSARPVAFSCLRYIGHGAVTVVARDSRRTTTLWTAALGSAPGGRTVRLPRVDARRDWVIDVEPSSEDGEIDEIALSTSMERLRGA